jgi:hypothetical protein
MEVGNDIYHATLLLWYRACLHNLSPAQGIALTQLLEVYGDNRLPIGRQVKEAVSSCMRKGHLYNREGLVI